MKTLLFFAVALSQLQGQSSANPPDLTGVWGVYRGGRGADQKLAPPPAGPLVLKPEYAKPYEERRALEAEANKRGEQLATAGAQCIPYGVPTMMSVAIYPVEFIQTPKQVTIISEAFSEVRRVYMNVPQAKMDDVAPGYYGRSVGKWDEDTLVLEKPVTYTLAFKRMPNYEMVEFVCDNNREYVDEKGVVRLQVHDK